MTSTDSEKKREARIFVNDKAQVYNKNFLVNIEDYVRSHHLDWNIIHCDSEEDFKTNIKMAVEDKIELLIIAGGDGTVSAAASIVAGTDSCMGIIPIGTGNDFARWLKISNNVTEALDRIRTGEVHTCDMGKFDDKLFINVAGAGFDAEVLIAALRFKKRYIPRKIAYLIATLYAALRLKSIKADITLEDENGDIIQMKEEILLMCFCNASYIGGGMNVSPKSEIDDGLLNLCMVRKLSRLRFYSIFPSVFKGKHIDPKYEKYIFYRKFKSVKMKLEQGAYYQVDGDIHDKKSVFEVEICAKRIKIAY